MPVEECTGENGKPGYRWGSSGACYEYTAGDEPARKKAKQRAYIQGSAIAARTGEPMKTGALFHLHKAFHPEALPPLDKAQALAIINELAAAPVEEGDVFVGRAQLANDQIDRSGERFPLPYLERFAQTLPGKPLLLGHDKATVPAGRWFSASVARDTAGVHHLVADFYLDSGSDAVRLLKLGIAKDVSIGFVAGGRTCDLCGTALGKDHFCEGGHRLNQEYDGRRCTATYGGDLEKVEALEGSLVGVGCQIGAQTMAAKAHGAAVVIESWVTEDTMNLAELEARVKMLEDENDSLRKDAALIEDGRQYHTDLLAEIERKAGVLKKPMTLEKALLQTAEIDTLKAMDAQLAEEINEKFPPVPQSKILGAGADVVPELGGGKPRPVSADSPLWMGREGW